MSAPAQALEKKEQKKGPKSVVHLAWAAYKKQLVKRPLPTKVFQCPASPVVLQMPPQIPPGGGVSDMQKPHAN